MNTIAPGAMPDAAVTVLADRKLPGWPATQGKTPASEPAIVVSSLAFSLGHRFDFDAHVQPCVPIRSMPPYRWKLAALDAPETGGLRMTALFVDLDDPVAHATESPARDEWITETRAKLAQLRAQHGGLSYQTRGGFRLVWLLGGGGVPLTTKENAAQWKALYRAWLAYLRDEFELVGDPSCSDPVRLYRLPYVTRDGVPQIGAVEGELSFWKAPASVIDDAAEAHASSTVRASRATPAGGTSEAAPGTLERARLVAREAAPSVSGENGDRALFMVACDLVRGLHPGPDAADLDALEAILSAEFNPRCVPPWEPDRLRYKLEQARDHSTRPWGYLADRRSDLGNAKRLVLRHGVDLRYFGARKRWLVWDGKRWAPDETGEVDRRAKATVEAMWKEAEQEDDEDQKKGERQWALKSQERSRIENMIALARTEPGLPVTARDLDADPWLLNVANGTLDLRSGELRKPDRALLMTKCTACAFVPGARSELWDGFVSRITGGDVELAAYVQRALGYALFGAWREKAFWFGYGPPDGGKSTLLGVVADVLGDYAVSADASTWMVQSSAGGNRGDLTRLLGARLVTTLEVRAGARFDQQVMKAVTGGDTVTAAAKYEHEIEFRPAFALWFGANDRPVIPDDDDGFWNRVRCVPFTNPIPKAEQDKALREKLTGPAHAPAVLAWLLDGCLAWQRDGIGTCSAVEEATRSYRRDMNQASGFFDEHCELTGNPSDAVPSKMLRARYDAWCLATGMRRPLQGKAWRARLLALGATGGDDASRRGIGTGGMSDRFWFGIRFKDAT